MSGRTFAAAVAQREPAWQQPARQAELVAAWDAACDRWPDVGFEASGLADYIAPRLVSSPDSGDAQALPDLLLAGACAAGDDRAISTFERVFDAAIGSAARGASETRRSEFRQQLRHKLFVGDTAKIREYTGRGSLEGWVRVTARRTFLDQERGIGRRRDAPGTDASVLERAVGRDLELDFLKRHYREQFRGAFGQALGDLEVRHRNVLRQHLVQRLSIDEIGALYDVHRSTAARWVQRARTALLVGTRQHMQAALRIEDEELDSIMRLIDSRLDVSVVRVLGTSD